MNIPQQEWERLLRPEQQKAEENKREYFQDADLRKTAYVREARRQARSGRVRKQLVGMFWLMLSIYAFILLGAFAVSPFIYAVIVDDPWWLLGMLITVPMAIAAAVAWMDW